VLIGALAPAGALAREAPRQKPAAAPQALSDKQRAAAIKLQEKMQELGPKLNAIQQAAMKKDAKLQREGAALESRVEAVMKKLGVDPNKTVARLQAIQAKAQQGKLPDAERQRLMMEFMQLRNKLQAAQARALDDKKIKAASEAFRKRVEIAMIKTDPGARKLLRQYKRTRDKLDKLLAE
jgi:small-conductance mechanosensitive channel